MPSYPNDAITNLRTLIGATWTDVKPGGIYRTQELARLIFSNKLEAGDLPCCAIDLEPMVDAVRPLSSREYRCRVTVYRIVLNGFGGDSGETPDQLEVKLEALVLALWPDTRQGSLQPIANAQVMGEPLPSMSERLPVNTYILANAKAFYAGAVSFELRTGYRVT